MTEVFKFPVELNSDGTVNQKVQTSNFGDGYSQATSIGINNQSEEWNVSFTKKAGYINKIRDFLDRHEGDKSFYWTPPNGKQGIYRSASYKLKPQGGNVFTLSTTFSQVFEPSSTEASEYVRYVNNVPPDQDGNVAVTALDLGAEAVGVAEEKIKELKNESNPFDQYALKDDIPDIPNLTDINNRLDIVEVNITTASDNLTDLQTKVNGINTDVSGIKTDLSNQHTEIYALQTCVSTNTTDIEELKNGRVKTINGVSADENGNIQLEIDTGTEIDDNSIATNKTWSSHKINTDINQVSTELTQSIEKNTKAIDNLKDWKDKKRFKIIYPHEDRDHIGEKTTVFLKNPFEGKPVLCIAEILYEEKWGETGWYFNNQSGTMGGTGSYGVIAFVDGTRFTSQEGSNIEAITVKSGTRGVLINGDIAGNCFPSPGGIQYFKYRVKVYMLED